jgi:hypothetical protein
MAGLTLAGAKPKLEADLKKLLEDALYEAEMSMLNEGADIDLGIAARIKNDIIMPANRKKAQKFAEQAYKPLAQAIYDFVSEIGITLTPKGTLIAPQAPSGALPITGAASTTTQDFTIT